MNYITMLQFGRMGRFANQQFQYAFLKLYAQEYNLELQLPHWVGNELFGSNEPEITVSLPPAQERWAGNHLSENLPPTGAEYVNTDWRGYGQYYTSYYRPYKNQFRGMFDLVAPIKNPLLDAVEQMWKMGKTIIGFHIRRGDYGQSIFHITPVEWYWRWLEENWKKYDKPVLFIAAEDRSLVSQFLDWKPITTDDFGVHLEQSRAYYNYLPRDIAIREPWQMDFVPDWYFLSQCDVLVTSNSTFSFTAAMMHEGVDLWRSSLPHAGFEKIDPWNSRPLRLEKCEDYPELDGVRLEENPYW